jgi:hypothetical protein
MSHSADSPRHGAKSIGCPNGNWIGVDPVFNGITSATLVVTQANNVVYGPVTLP